VPEGPPVPWMASSMPRGPAKEEVGAIGCPGADWATDLVLAGGGREVKVPAAKGALETNRASSRPVK
jgi:hypothetical protein